MWSPPALLPEREHPRALNGSLLFDQPAHAGDRDRLLAFVAGDGPVAVEIGFDHGMRILDHARRWPDVRWLGVEIRKRRVAAAAPHAPPNCLLFRGDARTVLARLVPAGRLARVDVLFPTPATNPRHLLITPGFVADLARALAPDGVVHVATDVEGLFAWASRCFAGWPTGEPPATGPVLSRRERVCKRDGLPVWRATWRRP
ncbi:MAG: tRNA (guanine(46)-N(7))-methyltransferase TrmB [Myxococcota bacterium]